MRSSLSPRFRTNCPYFPASSRVTRHSPVVSCQPSANDSITRSLNHSILLVLARPRRPGLRHDFGFLILDWRFWIFDFASGCRGGFIAPTLPAGNATSAFRSCGSSSSSQGKAASSCPVTQLPLSEVAALRSSSPGKAASSCPVTQLPLSGLAALQKTGNAARLKSESCVTYSRAADLENRSALASRAPMAARARKV